MWKIFLPALAAASVAFASTASADAALSFGIAGFGNYGVNTGNIEATTTTSSDPVLELVNEIASPTSAAETGISLGEDVLFSTQTFDTTTGADPFTLAVGDITVDFTTVSSVILVATGNNTNGSISEQFNGTVAADTSGYGFLGDAVSMSEACTQSSLNAAISCSDSVIAILGSQSSDQIAEPSSLTLLGGSLAALLSGSTLFGAGYRPRR